MAIEKGAKNTTTISDQAPVGAGLQRPAVVELRSLLQTGHFDLLVVDGPDRLSLSVAEFRAFRQEISRAGVRLVFLSA